jgi:hypothetical protein
VSARLKRAQRPDRGLEEVRETDSRIVHRHRTADTLNRMLEAGTISPEMCEAGQLFQIDFALAVLDPIRARPMMLPVGGGGAPELTESQLDARRRVHKALDALGGIGSPGGSCLWHVLGCGCSVREWAIRRGWSGQPLRHDQAAGILIAALGVLACWAR